MSGDWAFTGTRVPVYALFENIESGAAVKEFLEWYPVVKAWQGRCPETRNLTCNRRQPKLRGTEYVRLCQ